MGGGDITFSAKRPLYPPCSGCSRYAVCSATQCAVGVSAKRSLYPHAVDAVGAQYAVGTQQ